MTYFGEQNLLAAMLAEMEPASKQLGIGNGSVSWTSPVIKTAMTQIFDLKPYYNPGFVGLTQLPGAVNLFAGNKAAMYLGIVSNNQNYFQFQQTLGSEQSRRVPSAEHGVTVLAVRASHDDYL